LKKKILSFTLTKGKTNSQYTNKHKPHLINMIYETELDLKSRYENDRLELNEV